MNYCSIYGRVCEDDIKLEQDDQGSQVNFLISNLRRVSPDEKEITYIPVRTFDWLAEVVSMNAKKGDFVLVEGKLVQFDEDDGTYLGIEANRVMFVDQRRLNFPEKSWQDRRRERD